MALFVFAHQDDEVAAASRILYEIANGARVRCVFLTDGGRRDDVRNRESIAVLTSLGVTQGDIRFTPSIADGFLPEHLDEALQQLSDFDDDIVYCLAWEGGHQDHDASQLVAAAFAKRRGALDRCFEIPLYRGWMTRLFRVQSPLRGSSGWIRRKITFREGLRIALLAARYRSQRFSWLGLFPETFLKVAILRRELIRRVDPSRFRTRPHAGRLFYEGRFRFPYERFARATAPFIEAHFGR